jgi:hypothetical protein
MRCDFDQWTSFKIGWLTSFHLEVVHPGKWVDFLGCDPLKKSGWALVTQRSLPWTKPQTLFLGRTRKSRRVLLVVPSTSGKRIPSGNLT